MPGLAAVAAATILFSWGFIIVKGVGLPSPTIAVWRLGIALVFLGGLAVAFRLPWPRKWPAVISAGLCFGLHQLAFITASQLTSIAVVTLVGALQPVVVTLLSRRAVGERVPALLLVWGAVALGGVALVMGSDVHHASRSWQGDAIAVANLLVFTAYFLFAKRARQQGTSTVTLTACVAAVALLVIWPVAAAVGHVVPTAGWQWLLLALLALGPGSGHLLVNWAHARISAALASLVLASIPLLASLWAHLLFGEPYTWRHVVGVLLLVLAIEGGRRTELVRPGSQPP